MATFSNLTLNTAGSYKLTITDASLTSATSGTFAISAAAASKLAFNVAPSDVVAGVNISPAMTVDVEDKFGNVVATDASSVTIAIATGTARQHSPERLSRQPRRVWQPSAA